MATANLALPTPRHSTSSPRAVRLALSARVSPAGAAVLSVLGSMGAILIAAVSLLVVPIAAAIAFGPALLELI